MSNKDQIYGEQQAIKAFRFDDRVANVFSDMIKRSVPGYEMMLEMISVISQTFITHDNANCYDLGCSLGASTLAINNGIQYNNCNIFAIDNSEAMLEKAKSNLQSDQLKTNLEFICDDVSTIDFLPHQLSCMNFTLQFIARDKRTPLLSKIYESLENNGVLILSEKIHFENNSEQNLLSNLHHDFKRAHGYSDLEISQKRNALENVLLPETAQDHINRLKEIGFKDVSIWFQCFNFISLVAIK